MKKYICRSMLKDLIDFDKKPCNKENLLMAGFEFGKQRKGSYWECEYRSEFYDTILFRGGKYYKYASGFGYIRVTEINDCFLNGKDWVRRRCNHWIDLKRRLLATKNAKQVGYFLANHLPPSHSINDNDLIADMYRQIYLEFLK